MTTAAGYSGTPLPRKLGLKDGQTAVFVALPDTLEALATAAAFGSVARRADWTGIGAPARFYVIHAFTRARAELEAGLAGMAAALKPSGMIWVSWPKKAAKVETDVTEDVVRARAGPGARRREGLRRGRDLVGIEAGDPQGSSLTERL